MDAVLRIADVLVYAGAVVGALAAFAMAAMLIVEVITTSFFAYSQPWAVEYSGYFLMCVLFAGSGWTLGRGGHIRVDVLASALPRGAARLIDLCGSVFALGIVGFAAYALIGQAVRTAEFGSKSYYPSETPLVYPQGLLAASVALLAVAFAARILRLLTGRMADAGEGAVE